MECEIYGSRTFFFLLLLFLLPHLPRSINDIGERKRKKKEEGKEEEEEEEGKAQKKEW